MTALPCLAQQVDSAPRHHFTAVADERLQDFLEIQYLRLTVNQCHHIDTKHGLQAGLGVEVVQHHVADLASAQLDNHTHAVLVGLVAQLGDALDLFLFDQFSDALYQTRLVQLVR